MLVCERFDFEGIEQYYNDKGEGYAIMGTNSDQVYAIKAGCPVQAKNKVTDESIWVVPANSCEIKRGHTYGSIVVYGQVLVTCNKEGYDKIAGHAVFPADAPIDEHVKTFEVFMDAPFKQ